MKTVTAPKASKKTGSKKATLAAAAAATTAATPLAQVVAPTAPVAPAAAPLATIPAAVSKRVTIEDVESGPMEVKATAATVKDLRGESKRGLLLTALKTDTGITMSAACTKFEWKPRDFADALRLLAKVNGVTSVRDEAGHWRVKTA